MSKTPRAKRTPPAPTWPNNGFPGAAHAKAKLVGKPIRKKRKRSAQPPIGIAPPSTAYPQVPPPTPQPQTGKAPKTRAKSSKRRKQA